ncbi:ComEC/Rec2 family competence protein [Paraburkholderia sp. DHOC27]|uniref:ComEC/Rec2 family competence protein n=1 Tax=Paraburkholderia sp. DHOC27 TaxID=2303330 RepID=UPI000E3C705C|nr:ComEC/Rec2 family competence protein [Paraburkholderia sp. DHOC27]RFU45599.1 ComEC family competence protein [Paraburkholderia sp. DHOC27]
MRPVWCGFVLGVIGLQQQAALPRWRGWLVLCLLGATALAAAGWGLRGERGRVRLMSGWCALWLAAGCAGFGYAAWRADMRLAYNLPTEWEGRDLQVSGAIRGLPSHDDKGARFLFDVESVTPPLIHFPRTLQLSWIDQRGAAPPPLLEPGARWRFNVRLKRAHGNANEGVRDAEAALLARNVRATGYVNVPTTAQRLEGYASGPAVWVDRWRAALRERIDAVLADAPHRGIVVALAVGAQDEVSAADWALMRSTGTSHLVAISGLHIGFVAGLAAWLVGAWWRRSGFIGRHWPLWMPAQKVAISAGALFAAMHAALAGFNLPAQRALWMAGVVALAFVSGRTVALSVVLAWALGLVVLLDPWAVLAAGFWLSFCAVAAILYAMSGRPRVLDDAQRDDAKAAFALQGGGALDDAASRQARAAAAVLVWLRAASRRLIERVRSAAHVQMAITLALAPLTVYWFWQIPLVGPLANAFAIPWVSLLVTPAVLAGVALPQPLDAHAFHLAHELLVWLVTALQKASGPAWTLWRLPQPGVWPLAAAAVGVVWCLAPRGWPLRWAAPLTWLPLLWPAPAAPAPGAFRLTALDIGQGSSILVETTHHSLLFDAGPGPESTHAGERVVVPYLQAHGVSTLDTMVISHADSDHSGGAPAVLEGVQVRQLLAALAPSNALWAKAKASGAQTVPCAAGQHWQWDGVDFTLLWPDAGPLQGKPNDHCCVLRVSTAGQRGGEGHRSAEGTADSVSTTSAASTATTPPPLVALLAADIEAPQERILLARNRDALRAQILVVPHHGSRTSSTEPFLDSIEPLIAVFQVGYRNRFHHPNPGVFERYLARHIELTRSDEDGAVQIVAEGALTQDGAAHSEPAAGATAPNATGPTATLTLERYHTAHHRYWMD